MGTRSCIGILEDGIVRAIYCHWDGYPDHNGEILAEHYNTPAKARELIEIGDLSSLAPAIGERHDFNNPPKGVCNFYSRDRGETGTETKTFKTSEEMCKYFDDSEYCYIMKDGEWYVTSDDQRWYLLSEVLKDPEVLGEYDDE